jgi:ATP-dependent exoDNAse (exonuclease V) alpha subunit
MLKKTWADLDSERKSLFRLLSRFSLSPDANVYLSGGGDSKIMKSIGEVLFRNEARQKKGITCADADILANPYILYEKTRLLEDALNVPVKKVDMAVFPIEQLAKRFSLPEPTLLKSGTDMRRIRALAINILEEQSSNGHTFLPASHLVESINALPINPSCLVNGDILANAGLTQFVASEIRTFTCKRSGIDESAFQLQRLHQCDEQIRKSVSKRINAQRHNVSEDWNRTVASEFPNSANDATEQRAHTEKVAVLQELAAARLSVLLGGAGTGKTTLLAILCSSPAIQNGGIRLLAPTGKARVRMTQVIEGKGGRCEALTVAQFLLRSDRYDIRTGRYSLSDKQSANVPATVIIDESSMLTTEMFAALLEALKAAQRIIFVGDPNQLPPIGAGKPFVDVVRHLNQDIPAFPKVGTSSGELTVGRRQRSDAEGSRTDAHLAQWFVRSADECGDDNIFAQLQGNQCGKHLVFKQWRDNDDLERLILETVAGEAGMNGVDDITGFNVSLGGKLASDYCYFNVGAAKSIEDWQILAPVRGMPHGILNINHLLHNKYRDDLVRLSKDGRFNKRKDRSFPVLHFPMGGEQCVYGDKVINVTNKKRDAYPTDTSLNYVANGEIGIDVSQFGRNWDTYPNTPEGHKRFKKSLEYMSVEFASQAGVKYSFSDSDFGEESDAALELAYALTVHKAQGSQFKRVILVLAEPCWLLSSDLLYTALTRQPERVVFL